MRGSRGQDIGKFIKTYWNVVRKDKVRQLRPNRINKVHTCTYLIASIFFEK